MGRHSSKERRMLRDFVKKAGVEKNADIIRRKLKNKQLKDKAE